MYEKYAEFATGKAVEILKIDSPTGYTKTAAEFVKKEFEKLGCPAFITEKGGVAVDLGGLDEKNALLLEAHLDTLGGMVAEVKSNGRLRITPLGGLNGFNTEGENCRVITRKNGIYEGTFLLKNPSVHVNGEFNKTDRSFDNMEVVLDEEVKSADDVKKLGIANGDIVAFDTRTVVTKSGYIKSRFLDDKLSVASILGFAKLLKDENITPERKIYLHITVYEEVGHGAAAVPFDGITEVLSVDMGCVGDGLTCTEKQVSICAKDSGGPYNYEMTTKLIEAAEKTGADYAVDIYPHYGSDAEATLRAGHDFRHGLIGPGVYSSHGYERSHVDGVLNTIKILKGFVV
ncbi:MAG: M42 family metallopeptidase [Ruminococcaceae bacterium]|nr:M42 family metallopeptidase [Oscillospiraceae bacterium]